MSLLQPFAAAAQKSATVLARFGELFSERLKQRAESVTAQKQREINAINIEADKSRKLKAKLEDPLDNVDNTITRVSGLRSQIDALIKTVTNAEADPEAAANAAGYRSAFTSILNQMRNVADTARVKPNLLGEGNVTLTFPTNVNGIEQTVRGINLVSDYYIVDSEGKRFEPERTTNLLRRFDSYPEEPGETFANLDTGARLDSIDGNDVGFTLNADTADAAPFTGTVVREGIGILDSWLYDDFATPEGRARARSDLEAAKSVLDLEERRYGVVKSTIEFQRNRAKTDVKDADLAIEAIAIEQAQIIREAEAEVSRQAAVLASSLEHVQILRNEYTKLFNTHRNPLVQTLLDIRV
ncbi:MAG: hypothetical protein RIB59_05250 [Rhodospirillales bacterium]